MHLRLVDVNKLKETLDSCKAQVILVGFGLEGCLVCSHLMWTLLAVLGFPRDQPVPQSWQTETVGLSVVWVKVDKPDELAGVGLNIRLFPTLVAYLNLCPTLGWEGFAALEPSEIKEEIVRTAVVEALSLALAGA